MRLMLDSLTSISSLLRISLLNNNEIVDKIWTGVAFLFQVSDMKELLKDSKKLTTSPDDTSSDTQAPVASNDDSSWVWLTTDTRVPVSK